MTISHAVHNSPIKRAFSDWMRGGTSQLCDESRAVLRDHTATLNPETRALSTAIGSAGAYVCPTEYVPVIEEGIKRYSAVAEVATILPTARGTPLPYPTVNDTGNSGTTTAENTASATNVDPTFGAVTFGSSNFDSTTVLIPFQLLEDSEIDIATIIFRLLTVRVGRKMNPLLTTGTGDAQPMGILTAASLGFTAASPTAVAYSDLIELEHSVDPEYRCQAGYMLHDNTLKVIRKLVDSNGRPYFIANGNGVKNGRIAGTLDGFPVTINPDMPQIGAGNKSIAFGDFSRYCIRRVKDILLFRLTERYAEKMQVGFRAVLRADGNLLDAGTGPVKFLQH